MEQLSLYPFLPTSRSMPGPCRATMHAVIRSALSHLPSAAFTFAVLSPGNVVSPLAHTPSAHPSRFKCHLLQEALPHAPHGLWTLPSFGFHNSLTCSSVSGSVTSSFAARILEYTPYLGPTAFQFLCGVRRCVFCLWFLAQCWHETDPSCVFLDCAVTVPCC